MPQVHQPGDGPAVAHMGVGAFHRAHQAWYTHRASAAAGPWGIVAFTGRSAAQAEILRARDGAYTLVTRGADGDGFEQVTSIRTAHDGADRAAFEAVVAHPATHVVTLTVTESGYCADARGSLDTAAPAVDADLRRATREAGASIATAPVRLALALAGRRAAGGSPLTVVSCDNLSGNGDIARSVVLAAASVIDAALPAWIDDNIAFRSSMVDRITPRTTPEDIDEVERVTGIRDEGAVVTEPFSEWVIEDGFAGPRPAWDLAGARLVRDLAPYEQRKLRILNGAHSLLAYRGLLCGLDDVASAFGDPRLREAVEAYWDVASESCSLPAGEISDAVQATRERFANPRIRHRLSQIALDGVHKLPHRIVPVLEHAVRSGADSAAPASVIAAWALHGGHSAEETAALLSAVTDHGVARAMLDAIASEVRRLEADTVGATRSAGAVRS